MVEREHDPYYININPYRKFVTIKGVENFHYYPPYSRLTTLQIRNYLRKLFKKIRPDVLHTGWVPKAGFYGATSGFHPIILMPWGHDILYDETRPGMYEGWYTSITKFTVKRADMITCDCEFVKDKIVELYSYPPNKIVVFPWGIDQSVFHHVKGPSRIRVKLGWGNKKILIMTRNFGHRRYGQEYFIEALPTIINAEPKTRVIFVGDGELRGRCEKRIKDLGLSDIVYFAGKVDNLRLPEYLNTADIYVTTSLSDGTSVSLLEAIACGIPTVVADATAYYEWIEDGFNGYIVPRKDSSVLASQLIKLLKNESLQRKMGQRNLEIARDRADWEKNFDILEGIYRDLVDNRK